MTAYYATERDIENTLTKYKAEVKEDFQTILQANIESLAGMSPEQVERQGKDLPVIRMMDALLDYAYDSRASDIHIEPQSGRTIVRFRIDGILHDIIDFPVSIHDLLITRLKILSRLRTDEHRAPQDGKLQKQIGKEKIGCARIHRASHRGGKSGNAFAFRAQPRIQLGRFGNYGSGFGACQSRPSKGLLE